MKRHDTTNPYGKTLLIIVILFTSFFSVQAQVYVGGGFNHYKTEEDLSDNQYTSNIFKIRHFYIAPEIGYGFSKYAIGISFGYQNEKATQEFAYHSNTIISKGIEIAPYFRWNAIKTGPVTFFLDASYDYSMIGIEAHEIYDDYEPNHSSKELKGFRFAIQPGLSFDMSEKLSALLHFGLIGYSHNNDIYGFEGFGADMSMSTATLSFYYRFR